MSSVTELEVVPHVINPGRQIQCHAFNVRNHYLHRVLMPASRLIIGLMESDSNNSFSQNSARETRNAWVGWQVVRAEWEHAKKYRDAPHGGNEVEHQLLLPTPNEMASIPNMKIQAVCDTLKNFCAVVYSLDSNAMQSWVGPGDIDDVEACIAEVEDAMLRYLGTGAGDAQSGFDVGMRVPLYNYGVLKPDLDLDSRHLHEPSTERPKSPYPDFPDLPSTAPRPGTNPVAPQQVRK